MKVNFENMIEQKAAEECEKYIIPAAKAGVELGYKACAAFLRPYCDEESKWIELKEGCEIPDYDVPVLWYYEDGNMYVDTLDKDGNPHIFGYDEEKLPERMTDFEKEFIITMPKATHWRPLPEPPKSN